MIDEEQFTVSRADLIGKCGNCNEVTLGSFDCDSKLGRENKVKMICVSCHQNYLVELDTVFIWGKAKKVKK